MKTRQLDDLDKAVLDIAYSLIEESKSKRVSGSAVWDALSVTGIAPVYNGARLTRLVSRRFLQKDPANSSSRVKVYAPTEAGYKMWHELTAQAAPVH